MAEKLLVDCEEIDNFHKLDLHPLCEMFPECSDEDYDNLVTSMKERGFLDYEPVVVVATEDENFVILDGRNRRTAALDAGVAPTFVEYVGDDPMGFVMARNLDRRHLTAGQKAALASKLATMKVGSNQMDKEAGEVTQEEAAKLVQSNKTNIAKFKRVLEADPELAKQVELGHVPLDKAYTQVSKPKELGGGAGQTPQEAKQPEETTAAGTKKGETPASLRQDPEEKLGSQNMDFENKPKVERKFQVKLDRGPWESGNQAEDEFKRKHPIMLIGMGPAVIRLSEKEARSLIEKVQGGVDKLSS